jgi:predicted nucleotidyltransferase
VSELIARVAEILAEIERSEQVKVCLAVESGSRAWGFPSVDSDYDVRFIYAHHPDWYLSIDTGRDVIERPLVGEIDASGWDIRKALRLFRKSNPPLLEWLQSSIVYVERGPLAAEMRRLLPRYYSPRASAHHYLHMAQGNFREYLRGEVVWRKNYLYVLRPLLAMRWIESGRGAVPMEFGRLVADTISDPLVRQAVDDLVEAKRAGAELDDGPRIPAISEFIEAELTRFESSTLDLGNGALAIDELDTLFRTTLAHFWPASQPA